MIWVFHDTKLKLFTRSYFGFWLYTLSSFDYLGVKKYGHSKLHNQWFLSQKLSFLNKFSLIKWYNRLVSEKTSCDSQATPSKKCSQVSVCSYLERFWPHSNSTLKFNKKFSTQTKYFLKLWKLLDRVSYECFLRLSTSLSSKIATKLSFGFYIRVPN